MLARIAGLSESSAFRRAQDWPLWGHLLAGVLNELKALRSDMYGHVFAPILPPSTQRQLEAKRAAMRAAHDDLMAQLRGG